MGKSGDLAAVAVSAPVMIAGLVAVAVADGWSMRLGGSGMVAGASLALAVTGAWARGLGCIMALVGALVAVAEMVLSAPA